MIIIILASCVKTEKKYTKFLTNDSQKYWNLVYHSDLYDKRIKSGTIIYPRFREYYDNNGTWLAQRFTDSTFDNIQTDDIIYPNSWRLLGDSIIIHDDNDSVRIIMLSNDTLKYRTQKGDTLIFRNSIGDTIINHEIK